ncbi:hypothetical protein G6F62_008942 [Rhizopus arrhizus]|nr:hypothetical protein G6F62_008942 [Rhizopus arrhizus]KAG1370352.1 hypothetical protein G6F61_012110 [Rhizopus arrhizus]KAG1390738.1 hypothetical protein G6F60_012868 [Rhizopus arrhizus]
MSNDEQTSTLQEQMALLQQQLQQQQQQQQQQYPAHQPQPVQDSGDNSLPTPRAKYEWTPSNKLVTLLDMDQNLFVGTPLTDKQLASLIDLYPPNAVLDYRPPDAVTAAYGHMNESQRSHDASLKSIQYLLSAVFRSLNLLGHQLLTHDIFFDTKIKLSDNPEIGASHNLYHQNAFREIRTWMHRLQQWNGRSFLPQKPKETLFVDASDTGWGCHWQQ